ncbi:DNA recombination and repair protein RecF [Methylophaga frappieri]|uniref:DNA replication and repair protein RecF n=1 Tax=Methylophaga frappieri (strain ATCC BAA-2434 / DSM 25690 / JAM7) TaxID=754477 RepID=I1YJP1_METFJ|nr:DNA replication/repair protein RecF [Methylophaga frappieri]AFJ03134.1 DNA recombination and repair protein RecF [Methylophaga frappieri]
MIKQIRLDQFRNIHTATLTPAAQVNLFVGDNGAGKTSLLEAVYLLGMGRSFRTANLKQLIETDQDYCRVIAKLNDDIPAGLQLDSRHGLQIRLNNAPLKKLSELASHLPLQFIPANCHAFFEQGPKFRRKQVDWGLFHVEPSFLFHWQSYKKALQHRNAAIRQNKTDSEISLWHVALVNHGMKIHDLRLRYLEQLLVIFEQVFKTISDGFDDAVVSLRYQPGWPKEKEFAQVLNETIERDRILNYTRAGVHAADWSFKINQSEPSEQLSRGQQKLYFLAISLAQIHWLISKGNHQSVLLIDDLCSELDHWHQEKVLNYLSSLSVQSYISSTNLALPEYLPKEGQHQVFHVKHGQFV